MTTVVHPPVTATRMRRASRPAWRALARAESGHLIRHPGFVAGCAAMSAILVLATVPGVDFPTLNLGRLRPHDETPGRKRRIFSTRRPACGRCRGRKLGARRNRRHLHPCARPCRRRLRGLLQLR